MLLSVSGRSDSKYVEAPVGFLEMLDIYLF